MMQIKATRWAMQDSSHMDPVPPSVSAAPPGPGGPGRVRRRRSWLLWGAAIVFIIVLGVVRFGGDGFGRQTLAELQSRFGLGKTPAELAVSGNIEAHQSVLAFKTVQSRVVDLPFDEGQWVKAGTLIARVDDTDYRQQVAIAEAALEVQKRQLAAAEQNQVAAQKTVASDQADLSMKSLDYERYQSLWGRGYTPTQQRDQAATAVREAQAGLERDQALEAAAGRNIELAQANIQSAEEALTMARIVLGYCTLTAPFDGVILVREAELGEIVTPASPIVTLADLDHVWLRAYVNETDIGRARLGAKVAVTTDTFPGKVYEGRISFISPSAEFTPKTVETHAERVTLVYRIKIDIDNPTHELVPGMPADAAISLTAP
jgi:HlyD family secretion protein